MKKKEKYIYIGLCCLFVIFSAFLIINSNSNRGNIDGSSKNVDASVGNNVKGDLSYTYLEGKAPNGKSYKDLFKLTDKKIDLSVPSKKEGSKKYIGLSSTGNVMIVYKFTTSSKSVYTYCIEPGLPSGVVQKDTSRTTSTTDSFWNGLTATQRDMIQRAVLYGYPNKNRSGYTASEQYVATQIIIWEIEQKWRTNYDLTPTGRGFYNAWVSPEWASKIKAVYESILKDMKNNSFIAQPSFVNSDNKAVSGTQTLVYDSAKGIYSLTLTDKNKSLAGAKITCPTGLTCDASSDGSTLTISSTTPIDGKEIKFSKETSGNGLLILGSSSYQSLVLGVPKLSDSSSLKVSTNSGNLVIQKKCNDCDRISGVEFKVSKGSTVIATIKTDADGKAVLNNLPAGVYTVEELNIPEGYNKVDKENATIANNNTSVVTIINSKTPVKEPDKYRITLKKIDSITGQHVSGAVLVVKDSNNNPVARWETSSGTSFTTELLPGTYTIYEEVTPSNYIKKTTYSTFEVKDKALTITMKNEPSQVVISKKDATTGDELEGATLQILDVNGKEISCNELTSDNKVNKLEKCTWVSTKQSKNIIGLETGKRYILRETIAPSGYQVSEEIIFTVSDSKSTPVVMKDEYTKVTVSKRDLVTGEEIEGAELKLYDSEGNVIDEWTSVKGESHEIVGKLEAGKTYTLKETTAPKGYEISEVVLITIDENGKPNADLVIMEDKPVVEVPDTGVSESPIYLIVGCILLFAGCAGTVVFVKRRGE